MPLSVCDVLPPFGDDIARQLILLNLLSNVSLGTNPSVDDETADRLEHVSVELRKSALVETHPERVTSVQRAQSLNNSTGAGSASGSSRPPSSSRRHLFLEYDAFYQMPLSLCDVFPPFGDDIARQDSLLLDRFYSILLNKGPTMRQQKSKCQEKPQRKLRGLQQP